MAQTGFTSGAPHKQEIISMHSTEGSRDPAPVGMARAGFSFNHPFSPFAHRGGRFIGTDALRIFPVLHVSSDGQERNQLKCYPSTCRDAELFNGNAAAGLL
jgi:hypothetical protein